MRLCIASRSFDTYCETFIRQHIKGLPFDIVTLGGDRLDTTRDGWLLSQTRRQQVTNRIRRKLGTFDDHEFLVDRQTQWLIANKVDVVLGEFGSFAVKIMEATRRAGIPLVAHFHGCDAHDEYLVTSVKDAYNSLFEQASAVIAVSTAMHSRLIDLGSNPTKTHHVTYFVSPDEFKPGKQQPTNCHFLSVGRFVEKKAPHLTLLAFAKVLDTHPEARLDMAGDGPLLGACKWLASATNIAHAVEFHGAKDPSWVASAMQNAIAFVQHSVRAESGDSEGTPVAIIEAQCSGLPVVATRHTGIADVVVPGETGFLCEEGDYLQMARNMVTILDQSPDDRSRMRDNARTRITSKFSREHTIDRLAAIIRQVSRST